MTHSIALRRLASLVLCSSLAHTTLSHAQSAISVDHDLGMGVGRLYDGMSSTGLTPLVIEASTLYSGRALQESVELQNDIWNSSTPNTRVRVSVPPRTQRSVIVPAIANSPSVRLFAQGRGVYLTGTGNYSLSGRGETLVATVGLPPLAISALQSSVPGYTASAVRLDAATNEPLWPQHILEWGSTHVVAVSTAALQTASPEAHRALEELVLSGGILIVSPRSVAELRDPWLAKFLGPVTENSGPRPERISVRGPKLTHERFGSVASVGLGQVLVLEHNLNDRTWRADPDSDADLARAVNFVIGRGGALWSRAELPILRALSEDYSPLWSSLRPPTNIRASLLPIGILQVLYILAVAWVINRQRAQGKPLRALVLVPALAAGVFVMVLLVGIIARGSRNVARAVTFYELAANQPRALEHTVFALTVGTARNFEIVPPEGHLAVTVARSNRALGVLDWEGNRLSNRELRLGVWESASGVLEGLSNLGQGVQLQTQANDTVRVTNHTPLRFEQWVVLGTQQSGESKHFGVLARGASPLASEQSAELPVSSLVQTEIYSQRNLIAAMFQLTDSREESADMLLQRLFEYGSASPKDLLPAGQRELWALAQRPSGEQSSIGGFQLESGYVLIRVVFPPKFEPGSTAQSLSFRANPSNPNSEVATTPDESSARPAEPEVTAPEAREDSAPMTTDATSLGPQDAER